MKQTEALNTDVIAGETVSHELVIGRSFDAVVYGVPRTDTGYDIGAVRRSVYEQLAKEYSSFYWRSGHMTRMNKTKGTCDVHVTGWVYVTEKLEI